MRARGRVWDPRVDVGAGERGGTREDATSRDPAPNGKRGSSLRVGLTFSTKEKFSPFLSAPPLSHVQVIETQERSFCQLIVSAKPLLKKSCLYASLESSQSDGVLRKEYVVY